MFKLRIAAIAALALVCAPAHAKQPAKSALKIEAKLPDHVESADYEHMQVLIARGQTAQATLQAAQLAVQVAQNDLERARSKYEAELAKLHKQYKLTANDHVAD